MKWKPLHYSDTQYEQQVVVKVGMKAAVLCFEMATLLASYEMSLALCSTVNMIPTILGTNLIYYYIVCDSSLMLEIRHGLLAKVGKCTQVCITNYLNTDQCFLYSAANLIYLIWKFIDFSLYFIK